MERQTTQWPKDRQHNGQKTDNTMAERKRSKRQAMIYKKYKITISKKLLPST